MKGPTKTLIPSGLGLNCEKETQYSCLRAGAEGAEVVHTLDLLQGRVNLFDYGLIVFIGGFLDGDYLGSARVNVNRFKYGAEPKLREQLKEYLRQGRLILGICNGFQFLVKLGLLPFSEDAFTTQSASLAHNVQGQFEDRWVWLKKNEGNSSPFLTGIDRIYLPVRHGEGQLVVKNAMVEQEIIKHNLIGLRYADTEGRPTEVYPLNPNGSWENAAALSNLEGTVFGLMPHPEAYNHYTNHPHWTSQPFQGEEGEGLIFFKNAYRYLNDSA